MSYFADHLAWQQRVAQEFKAQSSVADNQMYQMQNGQWYNYPDLINYLRVQEGQGQAMSRTHGSGFNQNAAVPGAFGGETKSQRSKFGFNEEGGSQYGYAPKSQILYQRQSGAKKLRSKTNQKYNVGPYTGKAPSQVGSQVSQQKSTLSKHNMQRFNEAIPDNNAALKSQITAKSQVSKVPSVAKSVQQSQKSNVQKKMKIYQAVEKLDELDIDKISMIIDNAGTTQEQQEPVEQQPIAEAEPDYAYEAQDQVNELPPAKEEDNMTSVSQVKPTASQLSNMSGRTYISQLQKQLDVEKDARLKLEGELEDLKKISSEITSQLSQIQKQQQQQ